MISIVVMLLGFAVFGWGLHYKLSLYEAPTAASAREPAAKLLFEQQRPSVQARRILEPASAADLTLLVVGLLVIFAAPSRLFWRSCTHQQVLSYEQRFVGALFRRPPPFRLFPI